MKKNLYVIAVFLLCKIAVYGQQSAVKIIWTANLDWEYCQLDSVIVTNQSNERVVFYYPDTVLECFGSEVVISPKLEAETSLKIYPNPFSDKVQIEFSLVQSSKTELTIYDMLGKEIVRKNCVLEKGTHRFQISLPNGVYTLSLQTAVGVQSARLLSEGSKSTVPQIVSAGKVSDAVPKPPKRQKSGELPFKYGDTLVLQGFISNSNTYQIPNTHTVILTNNANILFDFYSIEQLDSLVLVAQGSLTGGENIPKQNKVITYNFAWQNLLSSMNSVNYVSGTFANPNINFSKYQAIVIFDSVRPYGGWSIDITNITETADSIIVTYANLDTGDFTCGNMQPYYIVRVPISQKPIAFIDNTISTPYPEYPEEIHVTDFELSAGWTWHYNSAVANNLYVINSRNELSQIISRTGYPDTLLDIDFTKYTLLFMYGNTNGNGITNISKSFHQPVENEYQLNVEVDLNDATASQQWTIAVLVRKLCRNTQIALDTTVSFSHIRVCDVDDPLTELEWLQDVIVVLEQEITMGIMEYSRIYLCTYRDGIGILVEQDLNQIRDGGWAFYNCEGVCIGDLLGHSGNYYRIMYEVDVESRKVIWEYNR